MGGGDGRLKRQASHMSFADIPQIVKDLKGAQYEAKEKICHLMDVVAVQQEKNPGALVAAGAIKPLVELLTSGNDGAQVYSASTLATIAAASHDYQLKIIDAGATTPLVTLLRMGSNKAQLFAAAAIAELSEQRSQQEPIVKAGAVVPLVRLLRGGGDATEDAHMHAADAVANLSVANPKAQKAFYAAGAVPLLLEQLHSGKSQTSIANALAKLLSPSTAIGAPANVDIQEEIANDGGIAPLLALLSGMTTAAQVHAAEALSNLANGNDRAQNMIAKAGGIGPLLALLSNKSTKAQAQGSSAIAQITRRNRDNQDSFSKSGGMPQLVGLLTSTDLEVQAMAALAITEVCRDNHENQTSAAECGCIASIVEQLKSNSTSAGVDEVKAEAVGAIWVISDKHPDNKTAVARAGGIQPTVSILAGGTPRAQEHAAYALSALGFDNVENQKQITSLLVSLLSTGSNEAKQNSTSLLLRLVEENPESQQDIATAGPMADLIGLLKEGSDGAKRFALWSLSLSINESNQKQLLEEGAIDPLVDTLNSTVPASRQQAAAAISRLANKNSKTQLEVAKKGGITPLIAIVNGVEGPGGTSPTEVAAAAATASVGSNSSVDNGGEAGGGVRKASRRPSLMVADHATSDIEAKQYAAAALAALASLPKVGKEIVDSGGLEPLVALLNGGDNLGKQYAAASLARLATRGPKAPAALEPAKAISAIQPLVTLLTGDCGDKAQEEAAGALFALADEVNNRIAITDAGGIGPLVTLLGSSNSESQKHAKGVLVRLSIESANRALIIKKLVDMLGGSSSEGSSAQEQAAAALANLASDSAENRVSIVDAGGIEPLLSIIGHKENSKAKEESLKAISKLAYNSESIQSAITQAGGIPLLVNAMASSSNAKEMMATAGLYSLAANALSQLAKGNCDNQVKITEAGAIPSLVAILGAPVPDLQANAAECLGNLSAGNPDNQAAIARTGAIAPLCTLLREGADEVKEQAAAALWSLSLDNKPNKDTVAKLGGVEPLVTLLVTGTSDNSLDQATGTLASMCSKHMENRETIAKLIVNRLASKNAMLQTPTGAVRLLSAVGKMCHGSNANQAAIAKAGGVPPLIMWLSGGFDTGAKGTTNAEAQAAAADALLSMVSGNDPLQAMISRSNGIAPLIELLANGTMDTQVGVCRLLWHLCGNGESATAILTGGGVQPLCNMLTLDDPKAQELAATVMLKLIKSNSACCVTIAELGGVVSLVKLSKDGTAAGQQQATCSLAEIAMVPANREIIAEAGGVDVLVGLLTSSVVGTSETAARALANLARNTTLTDESGNVVDEQASLEACAARRKKIAECGGTKQLIGMLSAVSLSSSIIARKMWELVSKVIGASPSPPPTGGAEQGEVAGSVKATKKPVNEEECIGVQEQAAATLADLAFGDAAMQHAIIHDGGVPPLLALLRSSSQFSQENAARAIWHLCESASNQGLIVEAGAINELVALSKTGSARAQGFAAAVISDLAKGAIAEKAGQEGDEEGGSQGEVEGAPKAAESDRLSVIAAAGGITPLVGLLTTGDPSGKES